MYLLRIEVKCFSRILCLPKLLEFPHISSLLSFLILSHHELFCAIPFCNHLSLIRALLLSLSLFISSSLSIYLSALSHEESDFYHLSTDERTALCWHRSQHSDGPWTSTPPSHPIPSPDTNPSNSLIEHHHSCHKATVTTLYLYILLQLPPYVRLLKQSTHILVWLFVLRLSVCPCILSLWAKIKAIQSTVRIIFVDIDYREAHCFCLCCCLVMLCPARSLYTTQLSESQKQAYVWNLNVDNFCLLRVEWRETTSNEHNICITTTTCTSILRLRFCTFCLLLSLFLSSSLSNFSWCSLHFFSVRLCLH